MSISISEDVQISNVNTHDNFELNFVSREEIPLFEVSIVYFSEAED